MSPKSNDSQIGVARSVKALRARVDAWRSSGSKVALTPTMGALHAGHISLVKTAAKYADRSVASIFVNPTQFAPHEDFSTYPREEATDLEKLQAAGCHLAFIPAPDEMYPAGFQTSISVAGISRGLCGDSRPHFFGGVATVVCKLLNQCRPDYAIFGEKDFQQLQVIRRMVRDLDMQVEIIGAPIVREADGLAMSSRNAYLSETERAVAPELNRMLHALVEDVCGGGEISAALARARERVASAGFTSLDYLEVRTEKDLKPVTEGVRDRSQKLRAFAAAWLGKTRLIDNMAIDCGD